MRNSEKILPLLLLVMTALGMMATTPSQRKSRYYQLQGMEQSIEGNIDQAQELYRRAYTIDPGNSVAAYNYGLGLLALAKDSASQVRGLDLMRQFVDEYPGDDQENTYYAYVCRRLGDLPEAKRVLSRLHRLYPDREDVVESLSDLTLYMNETDSALHYLTLLEGMRGESPELSLRKMAIWLNDEDTARVMLEADRMIAKEPKSAMPYLLKGNLFSYLAKEDSALAYYLKAESLEPMSGAPKMALAGYYNQIGDSAAYDREIYEALMLDDVDVDTKIEILTEYVVPILQGGGETATADSLFLSLREMYPHEAEIQDFAAQYAAEKDDYAQAAELERIAVDMAPEQMDSRERLITYLVANSDFKSAVEAYESIPPEMEVGPSLLYVAAAAYSGVNDVDKALAAADSCIHYVLPDVVPADTLDNAALGVLTPLGKKVVADSYLMRGDVLYKEKRLDEAFLAYSNAITADPENYMALNNYAYFLAESGHDLEKALEMSKRSIELQPESSTFLDTYAWILFKLKRYPEALEYQRKAVELATKPEDISYDLYEHLGDILFMNGEPAEALENWKEALKLNPDDELLRRKVKNKTYFYE